MATMVEGHWLPSSRRDPRAIALYRRHYSSRKGGRPDTLYTHGFTGPGEDMVLLTELCDALYVWRVQAIRDDGQHGVNCTVFRNESSVRSSDMIRQADALAWERWPEPRHFTYVDPTEVRSSNPGYCFICAGWRRLPHVTPRGLVILEITHP